MYEINLVPDVKAEMIKAQKTRNLVFFVCGAISAMAIGMVILLAAIRGGQQIRMNSQDDMLLAMTEKLDEYDGLGEILTIQSQLNNLESIRLNKRALSRVFTVLASMLPTGSDTVTLSALDINLEESTMNIEGQANAGPNTDGIDYRVLEAFTKQVGLMKYDYGRYVDKNGDEIPTMCIDEANDQGVPFTDEKGRIYAVWHKGRKGCDPSIEEDEDDGYSSSGSVNTDETEEILRTPNLDGSDSNNWYKKGYIDLDGNISGVAHFESQCIAYTGVEYGGSVTWPSTNNCVLAPGGIEVTSSSNGRQSGGDLVLRFTATLEFDEEIFNFNNKHLIAIAPSGRTNVTDSLLQLESMFSEKAMDCDDSDSACRSGS